MKIGNREFQKDVVISGIIHLALIIISYYSFPSISSKLPPPENVIMFDLMSVSSKVNIKTQIPKTEDKKEKPLTQVKKASIPQEASKVREVKKPDSVDKKSPVTKKKEAQNEAQKETLPAPVIKTELDKKTAPNEPKKVPKKKIQEDDPIDSLLKNLEESVDDNQKSDVTSKENSDSADKFFKGDDFDQRSPMSITEVMLIKKKIEENWRIPQSVQNLKNIKITAEIFLEKDGTIKKIDIINTICPNNKQVCALAQESVKRAIKATNKIDNLSLLRYETWKNLKLVFDPSTMF